MESVEVGNSATATMRSMSKGTGRRMVRGRGGGVCGEARSPEDPFWHEVERRWG